MNYLVHSYTHKMFLHINIVLLLCVSSNLGYVNYQIIKNLNSFFENDGNGTANGTKPVEVNVTSFNSDESDSYDEMVGDNSTRVNDSMTGPVNDNQNGPFSFEASRENTTFDNTVPDWPWSSSVEQLAPAPVTLNNANRTVNVTQIIKANEIDNVNKIVNTLEIVNATRTVTTTEYVNKTISISSTPKPTSLGKPESNSMSKSSKPSKPDTFPNTNNSFVVNININNIKRVPIRKSWKNRNYWLLPSAYHSLRRSFGFDPPPTSTQADVKDYASPVLSQSNFTASITPSSRPIKIKPRITDCPESEEPFNIGLYEIPTQKGLFLKIKNAVLRKFQAYLEKASQFMYEINDIIKLSMTLEEQCRMPYKITFKSCAKKLFKRYKKTNKMSITNMEKSREKVEALTRYNICETSAWPSDPKLLLKWIATEDANIQFALPHLLKEWQYCFFYCEFNEK